MRKSAKEQRIGTDKQGAADNLLFGRKPVLELLRHRPKALKALYVQVGANLPAELKQEINSSAVQVSERPVSLLDELTGGARHQGVVAELKPKLEYTIGQVIEESKKGRGLIVVTDQVTDPHNLGAIMRCSDLAGADALISTTDRSAPLSSATIRASAGAVAFLPTVFVGNLQRALAELKKQGFWIVGLDCSENSQELYTTDLPHPVAVVLGAEGTGIRRLTAQECDILISIPMEGHLESLNVSQAASVFLFEMLRRRRASGA